MVGFRQPRTAYVAERLRQTEWQNRQTVEVLLDLEDLYARRFGNGFHLMQLQMAARPRLLDELIIREEIKTGRRLTETEAPEFLRQEQERSRRATDAQRQAEEERRMARARAEYDAWIKAGGLP